MRDLLNPEVSGTARVRTGVPLLDDKMHGGFARPSTVLFFSRTPTEKRLFAEHFVVTGLREGERCLYVDFFRAPQLARRDFEKFGEAERGNLVFVDATSVQLLIPSGEAYAIRDLDDLTHIVETVTRAIREVRPARVVVDSMEFLADRFSKEDILKAWRDVVAVGRELGATLAFLFINWTYGEVEVARIHEMCDYVVDFETRIRAGIVNHFLRITEQAPGGLRTSWIPFTFQDMVGLRVFFPRLLITGPFNAGKSTVVRALCQDSVSVDRMGTTVAFDYGHMDMLGLEADVVGTPGQQRFDFVFKIFAREVNGVLLVIDATRTEDLERARQMLDLVNPNVPKVIVANKADLPGPMTDAEIRDGLGIAADVPIVRAVATEGQGIRAAVQALTERIMGV